MTDTADDTFEESAYEDLLCYLKPDEVVEWIVLGDWSGAVDESYDWPYYLPKDKRHVLLDPGDAEPLTRGWSFIPRQPHLVGRYAIQAWTNQRVLRTADLPGTNTRYTFLVELPRHPQSFHLSSSLQWSVPLKELPRMVAPPTPAVDPRMPPPVSAALVAEAFEMSEQDLLVLHGSPNPSPAPRVPNMTARRRRPRNPKVKNNQKSK